MAYKALYRAYRPQVFEEVAGQRHIIKTLENAVQIHKIAHAYLFSGPRGTGKTSVAKIFAKAINCQSDTAPCGGCEVCNSIMHGDHPDVIEIDAASNNGVDEVRDLIDKVKYAPINGTYKVYIIDEVHMMTTGAFNALLKTLEEPPAHAVFILATTEPHKILPTIISRCQRFDFKKVEEEDITKYLGYVLTKENMPVNPAALALIARLAEGGMRDALSILEQCLAFDTHVTEETINQIYGLLSADKKINFIKKLLAKDMKEVLISIEKMLASSIDIKRLTFDIIDILKDVIIYKNTKDTAVLLTLTKETIETIVPFILTEEAFSIIDILVDASNKYNQSLNAKIYFELAILKICNQVIERIPDQQAILVKDTTEKLENVQPSPIIHTMEDSEDVEEEATTFDSLIEEVENVVGDEHLSVHLEKEGQEDNNKISHYEITEEKTEIVEEENPKTQVNTVSSSEHDIDVSFDDILNILVQADRAILNEIKEKWEVIARYRFNLNTAKLATMLSEGTPVAAGNQAMIISFVHKPMVNDVNYSNNYVHLKQFLKEILGQEYDFIAVKESDWASIRERYILLHKQKQLPEPKEIILHHIGKVEEQRGPSLNEAQQFAVDMFGEDIVEFEK